MTANAQVKEEKRGFIDRYVDWFIRWMPDSMAIILLITIVMMVVVKLSTGVPFIVSTGEQTSVIDSWVKGFWALLGFSMQMTLVMVTGYVVANAGIVKKILIRLADLPRTEVQAVVLATLIGTLTSWIHWGLGSMVGIVIGQQILAKAKIKGYKIHLPLFLGIGVMKTAYGSHGLSQAPALMATTPGGLDPYLPAEWVGKVDTVPMTQTVLSPLVIGTILLLLVISFIVWAAMRPKRLEDYIEISDEFCQEILAAGSGPQEEIPEKKSFAWRMNHSPFASGIIAVIGLVWFARDMAANGIVGLSIDSFNFFMIMLGLLLCGSPQKFANTVIVSMKNVWGVVIQFPMYAGIFGLIQYTGFAHLITEFFLNIATTKTLPFVCYIYSSILNMLVPSGGSKFVIELPYLLPTALELEVPLWKIVNSYTWGDLTTNIIQPFWLLPTIALYKTQFSKLMPFGLIFCVICLIVHSAIFLLLC